MYRKPAGIGTCPKERALFAVVPARHSGESRIEVRDRHRNPVISVCSGPRLEFTPYPGSSPGQAPIRGRGDNPFGNGDMYRKPAGIGTCPKERALFAVVPARHSGESRIEVRDRHRNPVISVCSGPRLEFTPYPGSSPGQAPIRGRGDNPFGNGDMYRKPAGIGTCPKEPALFAVVPARHSGASPR
ncbi:MAG: hypothetical protein CW742_14840 [Methanoregula sp.]|nr:MAG: hypothetical protein CW742_14840 [Methanoregula sp.]